MEPCKREFTIPNGIHITSVVLDQGDFDTLCDMIQESLGHRKETADQVATIRKAKHLPMVSRGTKTQPIFEKFEIQTDNACFIVRGEGDRMLKELLAQG